eukprot:9063772-Alexandrium_andersonii.AAC.1
MPRQKAVSQADGSLARAGEGAVDCEASLPPLPALSSWSPAPCRQVDCSGRPVWARRTRRPGLAPGGLALARLQAPAPPAVPRTGHSTHW